MSPIKQFSVTRAPRVYPPLGIIAWRDYLEFCWMERPCWICERYGWCRHREPEAENVAHFERLRGKKNEP